MEHLFRVLAHSLETLGMDPTYYKTYVHKIYSIMGATPLRRFIAIRAPVPVLLSNFNHPFLSHQFITVLHVSPAYSQFFPSVLPGTLLPKLRHLSAPWCIAKLLIPGRPVQVFCDTELKSRTTRTFERTLVQLAKSASDIEELELRSQWSSPSIFKQLKEHMPHLKRLRLVIEAQMWYDPRRMEENTATEPKFCVHYTPLQELELRMEIPPQTRQPHQVSRPNCRIISSLFIPICPSLKLLSIIAVSNKFQTNERDIAPQCIFKLRRMVNGEWEERKFGIEIPQDAKGFPMLN